MIKNYFKVALRNLMKNKSYVAINTLGMGVALTCCLSAYLLVAYNIEFDNYINKSDVKNVVKVLQHSASADGYYEQNLSVPITMPPIAVQELSGIERSVRYVSEGSYVTHNNETFSENIHFADEPFFDIFKLKLVSGSTKSFDDPKSIILSQELAKKYFRDEDPIGKQLMVEFGNEKHEVSVGGVLEKMPLNSTFIPEAIMRIDLFLSTFKIEPNNWSERRQVSVLFELSDIRQKENVQSLMKKYIDLRNNAVEDSRLLSFELLDFYHPLSANDANQSYLHNRIPGIALIIFMTLGFIILLIACFNLTNTTMALTGKRLKEIGVRKVVGSTRKQIVTQFFLEIVITISLAVVAGWIMAQVVVPEFAAMWGLMYGLSDLSGANLILALILMLFVGALIAGLYPALFNSKFKPVLLLKGNLRIKGTNGLTRTLLVSQFALSVIVLVAGIVFTQNAKFQNEIDFGYDKSKLMTIKLSGQQDFERLKNVIRSNPKIESISGSRNHVGPYASLKRTFEIDTAEFVAHVYEIGPEYLNTLGLDIVEGRDFIEQSETDLENAVIVDKNFVEKHELKKAIDSRLIHQGKTYRIIGVVENHLDGLKNSRKQDHLYQLVKPEIYRQMIVRTQTEDLKEVQNYIENQWKELFPGRPFASDFQEDILYAEANQYNRNMKRIFLFLTILGCLLSISGIYSLATLNIQKRTKEIGVRKVLGASESQIVKLVNKEFLIILLLAMVIGGAGGFLLTKKLLSDLYVQHIEISIFTVLISGLIIFLVGMITTSGTIFKASRANPTKTLKVQ